MRRSLSLLALLALAPGLRAQQLPFFADGTAMGGSRIFSLGLNPLGNPARFAPRPGGSLPGTYATYLSGGMEAPDFQKTLDLLKEGAFEDAIRTFATRPWGQRSTALGLAILDEQGHFSLTRESTTALWAVPDLAPARMGAGFANNGSVLETRRSTVDRLVYGLAGMERGTGMGASVRAERWSLGKRVSVPHPTLGQHSFTLVAQDPWGFATTDTKVTALSLDAGITVELGTGLQIGLQADRLVGGTIGDVEEKPQARAGLQVALGSMATLSVEIDLNSAARMPYPVKQKNQSASLVLHLNPSVSLTLGAERRQMGELTSTRTGATLRFITPSFVFGAGLQLGADQPLRGGMLRVY